MWEIRKIEYGKLVVGNVVSVFEDEVKAQDKMNIVEALQIAGFIPEMDIARSFYLSFPVFEWFIRMQYLIQRLRCEIITIRQEDVLQALETKFHKVP